jgi:hypothetical protein
MQISEERVQWHLDVPVCRILRGLKTHLAVISLSERWRLCWYFGVDSAEALVRQMWARIKSGKRAAKAGQ